MIRTRFSPSPTGMMHIGNARSALFSALFSEKNKGVFILRIEDTDLARSDLQFATMLQADLKWLGIEWQEGPGVDGDFGPYWQSARQNIYATYYKILEEKKLIYPCFCSDQDLLHSRKIQLSRGQPPRYAGTCRHLETKEIEKRLAEGKKPAWRFIVPKNKNIEFVDLVKGAQLFKSDDIGDFIIRRADGTAPFLFCNAIDDALMKVTHVIRGEDHVANTPRQILLLSILDLPIPFYAHLSLIMGEEGAKLSKRLGSMSVQDLKEKGYLPLALINYLVRLGHGFDSQELLDFNSLANHFSLEKLSRSPARFDYHQLLFWQKLAIQKLNTIEMWRWLGNHVEDQVPESLRELFINTIKSNIAFPDEALMWAKIFFHQSAPVDDDVLNIIKDAGEQFFVEAELAVDKFGTDFQLVLKEMQQTLGLSGKKLFMPLRIALTGKKLGPELLHVAELLGKEKMKYRLGRAFKESVKNNGI